MDKKMVDFYYKKLQSRHQKMLPCDFDTEDEENINIHIAEKKLLEEKVKT